jgi:glycosyltransferase involved in cell wall biosynthesis
MSAPLITVVTVCFNSERTIGDTLRSVAQQECDCYEHLIIDGGSTDGTLDIVSTLSTERTRVISEADRGVYDAMNKGIEAARGAVVGFLNGDDFYRAPNVLASVVDRFRSTAADVVYGDIEYVDKTDATRTRRRWSSGPFKSRNLQLGWHPPHPAFFARKQLLQSIGSFALDLHIAADYELMVKMLREPAIRVEYMSQVMVRMREGGRSTAGLASYLVGNWQSYVAMKRNGLLFPALMVMLKPVRKIHQFAPRLRHKSLVGRWPGADAHGDR